MDRIEPKYVTFEQAKLLKEKGCNIETKTFYASNGKECDMIYDFDNWYYRPEQWQVVEWLFLKHKIYIHTTIIGNEDTIIDTNSDWSVSVYKDKMYNLMWGSKVTCNVNYYKSKQKAYSAAFDYILKELI